MTEQSPWEGGREISLTIKHAGGYDAPWTVFKGTVPQLRADLLAYAGLSEDAFEGKPLQTVFLEIDKAAKAEYAASDQLGGKVISQQRRGGNSRSKSSESKPAEAPASDENPLLAQIQAINTVEDLKRLWAENQEAFKDGDLMASWKAKGQELSKK